MNVAALQSFLKNLATVMEQAEGRTIARELEQVCQGLEPFKELRIKEFAEFLIRAEQYTRDPNLLQMGRTRSRRAAQPIDGEKVRTTAIAIRSLEERAADGSITLNDIKTQLGQIGEPLTKEEALEVAKEVGVTPTHQTKAAALREIRHRLEERKRTAAGSRGEAPVFGSAPAGNLAPAAGAETATQTS